MTDNFEEFPEKENKVGFVCNFPYNQLTNRLIFINYWEVHKGFTTIAAKCNGCLAESESWLKTTTLLSFVISEAK